VVWREADTPKGIGDMPHTWVGSDFVRSVLTMFAYERERDTTLVVAAGLPDAWVRDSAGIGVQGLRTYGGALSYTLRPSGKRIIAELSGPVDLSVWKIALASPLSRPLKAVKVDGKAVRVPASGEVQIRALPAKVELTY
jgi:hypothetical protein